MADSYRIVGDQVVPYSGGRRHDDTTSWRDATDIELEQQARINQLESALGQMILAAECCDAFPRDVLNAAQEAA
jgi:hypothetical protein